MKLAMREKNEFFPVCGSYTYSYTYIYTYIYCIQTASEKTHSRSPTRDRAIHSIGIRKSAIIMQKVIVSDR